MHEGDNEHADYGNGDCHNSASVVRCPLSVVNCQLSIVSYRVSLAQNRTGCTAAARDRWTSGTSSTWERVPREAVLTHQSRPRTGDCGERRGEANAASHKANRAPCARNVDCPENSP